MNINGGHQLSNARRCFSKTWQNSGIQISHLNEKITSSYQPGGTLTGVVNNWTSQIIEHGMDPYGLGQWSYMTLQGKGDMKIVYRQISQSWRSENRHDRPDPHRQCILDLQAWVEHITREGALIILSLDANEEISDQPGQYIPLPYDPKKFQVHSQHNGSLATLAATCGLVDPLALQHKQRPIPSTCNRGQRRLDYILILSHLL
jgi:hypothetical protein